jgi:signal transduction histidine kinase
MEISALRAGGTMERTALEAVTPLLEVLCEVTGMRFAAVARLTGATWTVYAAQDGMNLGSSARGELGLSAAFFAGAEGTRTPVAIERVSIDPRCASRGESVYPIESYASVPIVLASGLYFGNLCALDPEPSQLSERRLLFLCERFATLIAAQLDGQSRQDREAMALLDERAASDLREQFIAILGHDLRSPLQAIYSSSDRLTRKLTDLADRAVAARIKAGADRMSALISEVLDFARGHLGGGIDLELSHDCNIATGLAAVVQELRDADPNCHIIADINVDRSVRCDLGRIQQVAANLLGNAVAHGLPHGPVELCARTDDDDLVLEVWNAGRPIPAESIDKIFEPFWRHSSSSNRNGLGLGLHICSQIVRAHGGRIFVTSTAADGTRFTARLPLADRPAARPAYAFNGLKSQSNPRQAVNAA